MGKHTYPEWLLNDPHKYCANFWRWIDRRRNENSVWFLSHPVLERRTCSLYNGHLWPLRSYWLHEVEQSLKCSCICVCSLLCFSRTSCKILLARFFYIFCTKTPETLLKLTMWHCCIILQCHRRALQNKFRQQFLQRARAIISWLLVTMYHVVFSPLA